MVKIMQVHKISPTRYGATVLSSIFSSNGLRSLSLMESKGNGRALLNLLCCGSQNCGIDLLKTNFQKASYFQTANVDKIRAKKFGEFELMKKKKRYEFQKLPRVFAMSFHRRWV